MRSVVVVVLLALLGGAGQARAQAVRSGAALAQAVGFQLHLDSELALDVLQVALPELDALVPSLVPSQVLPAKSQALQLPADYAWIERDTRAFWYSAGASAVTALGAHVLIGIPVLVLGGGLIATLSAAGPPVVAIALALGIAGTYAFAESVIAALAGVLVFNGMSEIYEADYLPGLMAHFLGTLVSTTVTTLTFGGGLLLFHGMTLLSEFTGSAGVTTLQIFSFLGAMPAVVIAGIALIAVPALVSSWAMATSAHPRAGYEVDENWQMPTQAALPPSSSSDRDGAPRYAVAVPLPALP